MSARCEACGEAPATIETAMGWRLCPGCFWPVPEDGHEATERRKDEQFADDMARTADLLDKAGWL